MTVTLMVVITRFRVGSVLEERTSHGFSMGMMYVAMLVAFMAIYFSFSLFLCTSDVTYRGLVRQRTVGADCLTVCLLNSIRHICLFEVGVWQCQVEGLLATSVVDEEVILLALQECPHVSLILFLLVHRQGL